MCLGYAYLSYMMEISTETPLILALKKSLNFKKRKFRIKKKNRLNVDVFSVSMNLNSKILRCFAAILF